MKAIIASLALAVALGAPAVTAEPAAKTAVLADLDGNVVVMTVNDVADHSVICPAPAPCVTGPHAYGFGFILHGFFLPGQGVYSSVVADTASGKGNAFTCVINGFTFSCQLSTNPLGNWPTGPGPFQHACAFAAASSSCLILHF